MHICQIEIEVPDVEEAFDYYAKVFEISASPCYISNYVVLDVPANNSFGIALKRSADPINKEKRREPPGIVLNIKISNHEAIYNRLEKWGGRVHLKKRPISYGIVMSQIIDKYGIRWGLISNEEEQG